MTRFVKPGLAIAIAVVICVLITPPSIAGERNNSKSEPNEITWSKSRKLSWADFQGPIPEGIDKNTAAATYCGIGFETNTISARNTELKIKVYNTFYINNSWAKPEEVNDDVLAHEQGHFDLCELYTRKLRERLSNVSVDVNTLKPVLRGIYDKLQAEYRARQEQYEGETAHGVNLSEQRKWQQMLERELSASEKWSES